MEQSKNKIKVMDKNVLKEIIKNCYLDWQVRKIDNDVINVIKDVEKYNSAQAAKVAHAEKNMGKYCLMLETSSKSPLFRTTKMVDYFRDNETGLMKVLDLKTRDDWDNARSFANVETTNLYNYINA